MRASSFTIVFALLIAFGGTTQAADALKKNAISPERAGRFFASICFDLYPDLAAAQKQAQRKGFRFDADSGLFVNANKDQQMRITSKRCALRFLTDVKHPELLKRFGDAASNSRKSSSVNPSVHLGTEDAGNGLTRVGARLDL